MEGWAVVHACRDALRAGLAGPELDVSAALAIAAAAGVPARVAGPLIGAYRGGMLAGLAAGKETA